eukprot:1185655-Prorocentrum_minimum.AAC.4
MKGGPPPRWGKGSGGRGPRRSGTKGGPPPRWGRGSGGGGPRRSGLKGDPPPRWERGSGGGGPRSESAFGLGPFSGRAGGSLRGGGAGASLASPGASRNVPRVGGSSESHRLPRRGSSVSHRLRGGSWGWVRAAAPSAAPGLLVSFPLRGDFRILPLRDGFCEGEEEREEEERDDDEDLKAARVPDRKNLLVRAVSEVSARSREGLLANPDEIGGALWAWHVSAASCYDHPPAGAAHAATPASARSGPAGMMGRVQCSERTSTTRTYLFTTCV